MVGVLNVAIYLLVSILVILIPVGIILGIVLAVKASDEQDKSKKKKTIWFMITSFIAPIVLLAVVISAWGLVNILTATFTK